MGCLFLPLWLSGTFAPMGWASLRDLPWAEGAQFRIMTGAITPQRPYVACPARPPPKSEIRETWAAATGRVHVETAVLAAAPPSLLRTRSAALILTFSLYAQNAR